MPVAHIGLTVTHLSSACDFFLAALEPLGYRFIGQQGNQIALGIEDADFFITQESGGMKAGAAHIAFSASSRAAVRDFYARSLNAGARPHGSPALRNEATGYFNAAVLDFDGNSVEVVYREGQDSQGGAGASNSRVLTYSKSVVDSADDAASIASGYTVKTSAQRSVAPSVAPSVQRSLSAPVTQTTSTGDNTAKTIIGTLLGAAAGAAVAYAMCKGEEDSAKQEAAAFLAQARQTRQLVEPILQSQPIQQRMIEPPPQQYDQYARSSYEEGTYYEASQIDGGSVYSASPSQYSRFAIEAGPGQTYQSPSYASVPPTVANGQSEYYAPASVVSGASRSQYSSASTLKPRGNSVPMAKAESMFEDLHISDRNARSVVSRSGSKAPGSTVSRSAPSKAPGSTVSRSQRSHAERPSNPTPSKAGSIISSILGRGGQEKTYYEPEPISGIVEELSDDDSLAPGDSISNVGLNPTRRKHSHRKRSSSHSSKHRRDSAHDEATVVSRRSSTKHTPSQAPSYTSHRSSRRRSDPEVLSEAGSQATIKPSRREKDRDSVVQYGSSAGLPPVRGITPSMVGGPTSSKRDNASVAGGMPPVRGITPSMVGGPTSGSGRRESSGGSVAGSLPPVRGITASMVGGPTSSRRESSGGSVAGSIPPVRGITPSMVGGPTSGSGRRESSSASVAGSIPPIRGITASMIDGPTASKKGRSVVSYAH